MLTHLNQHPKNPDRVFLLGGSGFIGKEIVALLNNEKIPVVSLSSKEVDLIKSESVELLSSKLKETDTLVFLSALTPDKGKGLEAFEKNIAMGVNVLKVLEKQPIDHLIYFSSDAVYSMQESLVSEKTVPNPEDLYGLMHLTREKMMKFSFKNTAIVRPTLVYGIEDTHNSYGPNRFRRMAAEKKEITLFGGGEEKRDHIFVNDLIQLVARIILMKSIGEINAVTGQSISYKDLAQKVQDFFGEEVKVMLTERKNSITHRHYNNTEIFKSFPDYKFTELEEGLKSVHEKMKKEVFV